jgi:hypothetical protein
MQVGAGDDQLLRLSVRIGAPPADGPAMPSEDVPEVNIWRDKEGRIAAFLFCFTDGLGICFPKFASYIFPEAKANQERIQIVIEPAAMVTRAQVIDHLMRNIVPLLLQSRGIQVFHASAIRLKDGVLGLCGRSFSGKSTLAYALGKRGYEVWADDSLLISTAHRDVRTLKTPPVKLRLRPDSRKYFGEVDGVCLPTIGDAIEFELSLKHEAPLKALCLIHRTSCLIHRTSEKKQGPVWRCKRLKGHPAFTRILNLANYYNLAEFTEHRRISETCLSVASKVPIYDCYYRDGFDFIEDVVDQIEGSLALFQ